MREVALKKDDIQKVIIKQYENVRWNEVRRKLLTGSYFGRIISRRLVEKIIVKSFLYNLHI